MRITGEQQYGWRFISPEYSHDSLGEHTEVIFGLGLIFLPCIRLTLLFNLFICFLFTCFWSLLSCLLFYLSSSSPLSFSFLYLLFSSLCSCPFYPFFLFLIIIQLVLTFPRFHFPLFLPVPFCRHDSFSLYLFSFISPPPPPRHTHTLPSLSFPSSLLSLM